MSKLMLLKIANELVSIAEKVADTTPTDGVSIKHNVKTDKRATPLSLLQENSDDFLLLMRTLEGNSDLKKKISNLNSSASNIQRELQSISKELEEILSPDNEDLQLEGDLNTFASSLGEYSKEFSELVKLASLMYSMSKQGTTEEKHKPVEHKLDKIKIVPEPKKEDIIKKSSGLLPSDMDSLADWVKRTLRPEEYDGAFDKITKTFMLDPDYWENKSWKEMYEAAKADELSKEFKKYIKKNPLGKKL